MTDHDDGSSGIPLPGDTIPARWLRRLLQHSDASIRIDEKVDLLGALHGTTRGSEDSLKIALEWTASWEDDPGPEIITRLWQGWRERPAEKGFEILAENLAARGLDWRDLVDEPELERQPVNVTETSPPVEETNRPLPELLIRFSLVDELSKLKSYALLQEPLCSGLALKGQANVWYAEPNTGKTAMAFWFLVRDIQGGRIDPSRVFFFNLDDTLHGLIEKTQIAKAHGFHVISEGYRNFQAADFPGLIQQLVVAGQCEDVVIVLDTLKKFTDIMDKGKSSAFGKLIRGFVLRGGTCFALAHVNKRRNADGEPIYAGTTDILEDFDCAFLVYETHLDPSSKTKTILFQNKKSRGNVRKKALLRYSVRDGLSYPELLHSIEEVSEEESMHQERRKLLSTDQEHIDLVRDAIRAGVLTKMAILAYLVKRSGLSKRRAIKLLERYQGNDPERHYWNYQVGPRGAKTYRLIYP